MEKNDNSSLLFKQKKKLLDLEDKYYRERHKRRMQELEFVRETNRLQHEYEMETQRIKGAEIRKNLERKRSLGLLR